RYSVLESSPRVAVHGGLPAFLELIQPRLYRGHPESMSGFASTLALGAWLFVLVTTVRRGRWRSTDFFFVLLVILTVAAVLDWPVIAPAVDSALPIAANARLRLVLCFALGVVTASALNVLARAFAFHTIASMLAIVVIIAELWGFGRNWMPNLDSRMFYPATPIIEKLQELRHSAREPFRITGTGPVLFPNTSAIYGLEDVRAHDPMTGARYIGLLRELSGYDPSNYFAPWADFNTRLLDFLNVRYIATTTDVADLGDPNRYQVVYEGRDGKVFENTSALPRVFPIRNVVLEFRDDVFIALLKKHEDWATTALLDRLPVESDTMRNDLLAPRPRDAPEAMTRIVSGGSRRLRVNVSAPRYSLIATSIQWWPGWRVRTNDRALEPLKINATFVGFVVPPGRHEVEIVYSPTSFWVGVWLALATAMVLLTVGLSRRLRRDAV
ncbi:MAG TPA: YfhO family protein, partial [Thermoanaerobaculia bacterium]